MNRKEVTQSQLLDQALVRIQSGEATVDDCLNTYPEYRSDLEPLLLTALQIHRDLSPVGPREAYIKISKIRIQNHLHGLKRKSRIEERNTLRKRILVPQPVFIVIGLALVLVMVLSGIGVTKASANALPGDSLYAVKRGMEELKLLFSLRAIEDAKLLTEFSNERLHEIEEMIKLDPTLDISSALNEYDEMLNRLLLIAQEDEILEDPATLEMINSGITNHETVLERVLESAPPSAQSGLENAIENSEHGKEVIEQIREGGSPSDLAPGQQNKETREAGSPEETPSPLSEEKTKKPKDKDLTPTSEPD